MTTELPTIIHPTNRPNFTEARTGPLTIWYSYKTPIAFHHTDTGLHVRQNDWSNTTGRHLNYVDGGNKAARLSAADFETALAAALSR